jgi:hypothetical protein
MSAQAVVTSSAHAGLKNKSFVYYVCTGSSYFSAHAGILFNYCVLCLNRQ